MALQMENRKYKLTGITPLLGSQPASRALRTEYISSKAPSPAQVEEEDNMLGDIEERGLTVFLRDDNNDSLIMLDYMLRGYLKGSLEGLVEQTQIKQPGRRWTATCSPAHAASRSCAMERKSLTRTTSWSARCARKPCAARA